MEYENNRLTQVIERQESASKINKHLWIESQKAGHRHNAGIERATDEWLRLYAYKWMKHNMPAF